MPGGVEISRGKEGTYVRFSGSFEGKTMGLHGGIQNFAGEQHAQQLRGSFEGKELES